MKIRLRSMARHLAIASTLAVGALSLVAATAATAEPTSSRPAAGAGWLARQFIDGNHLEVTFGPDSFPDYGLTADAVFALAAAGVAGDAADAAVAYLALNVENYTGAGPAENYAGPTAKLLLLASVAGEDPGTFGGFDLVADLLALEAASGRFSDVSAFGDFSNVFGQSLAIIALEVEGTGASTDSVAFLAGAQCPDGGFPESFGLPACQSSVDATAFAVQALLATGSPVGTALDFLAGAQNDDGSFDGAVTASGNSTGLAAQALRVGGRTADADEAVAFLLTLQQGCSADAAVRGAVTSTAGGAVDSTAERATAQAVPGMAGVGLAALSLSAATPTAPELECLAAPTSTTTTAAAPTTSITLLAGSSVRPTVLARTGDGDAALAASGLASVLAGIALVEAARRRRSRLGT